VEQCPKHMQPLLYSNVLLTGGNALLPNFKHRLERELRELVPCEYHVNVVVSKEPLLTAWQGGSRLACDPSFSSLCVTKQEYDEFGYNICIRKFGE